MPDYLGALGSYGVLLLVGESDTWAPVAVAIAWAVAFALALELITDFSKLNPFGGSPLSGTAVPGSTGAGDALAAGAPQPA